MGPAIRTDSDGEPWDAAVTAIELHGQKQASGGVNPEGHSHVGPCKIVQLTCDACEVRKDHTNSTCWTTEIVAKRDFSLRRSAEKRATGNGDVAQEHVLGTGGPVGDPIGQGRKLSMGSGKQSVANNKVRTPSTPLKTNTGNQPTSLSPAVGSETSSAEGEHRVFLERLGQRWVTVEPLIVAYMVAYMALLPILQQYCYFRLAVYYNITEEAPNKTRHEQCRETTGSTERTPNEQEFQDSISLYNTMLIVMSGVPTLVATILLGSLSDRLGRRMCLLPQLAVAALSGLVLTTATGLDLPLWVLPTVQFVVGLSGSMPLFMATAFSYLADINPPEKRYMRILIMELAIGLSSFVGQSTIGWLIDVSGFVVPCVLFTITLTAALLYCIFFLPETVRREPGVRVCTCTPLVNLGQLWFRDDGIKSRRVVIWISLFIMFTYSMTNDVLVLIQSFYLLDPPLCWSPTLIGIFNGVLFILKAVGSLGLMKLLFDRVPSSILQLIGLVSVGLFNIAMGLSKQDWVPFLAAVVGCGTSLLAPVTRSIASGYVPDSQQGALFTGLGWAQMVSLLVGSPVVNLVYAQTPVSQHGLIYILGTIVLVLPLALVGCLLRLQTQRPPPGSTTVINGVAVHDTEILVIN